MDTQQAHQFIQQFSFGLLVSQSLDTTHLPFTLDPENGSLGTLHTHLSRANEHWKILSQSEVLVVFNGPHSYISPSWYQQKPAVPTWNYATVKVRGIARQLDADQAWPLIKKTMAFYEPNLESQNNIVTDELVERLINAIVPIAIDITEITPTQKLGQHRSREDQSNVYRALKSSQDLNAQGLAQYMLDKQLGIGSQGFEHESNQNY